MEDENWNLMEEKNSYELLNEIDIIDNNEEENDNELSSWDNKYIWDFIRYEVILI